MRTWTLLTRAVVALEAERAKREALKQDFIRHLWSSWTAGELRRLRGHTFCEDVRINEPHVVNRWGL